MLSISQRIFRSAAIVLALFLGLMGIVLMESFRKSEEASLWLRLGEVAYSITGLTEFDRNSQLQLPRKFPQKKFTQIHSGLYARIWSQDGKLIWKSDSLAGLKLPGFKLLEVGQERKERFRVNGKDHFSLSLGIAWANQEDRLYKAVIQIIADTTELEAKATEFSSVLWIMLGVVSLLLLTVQLFILRWGLSPLRQAASDMQAVQSGESEGLAENYPAELQGLASSVNAYIHSERAQKERYRNSMADLAHSLKTPLAVMQSGLQDAGLAAEQKSEMEEQITRMRKIMDYQLQRATLAGKSFIGKEIPLKETLQRIVGSLQKVHGDKNIQVELDIADDTGFPGDEGDLFETAGNLLENAFKWARSHVRVSANIEQIGSRQALRISVEDDGPGIAEEMVEEVLKRGIRADQTVSGHGIGLSVVQDIIDVYQGEMQIGNSDLGGAAIRLVFPLN